MSAVVIGVGNPARRDDGVGLRAAAEARASLAGRADVVVVELCAGGMRLMEAMAGHDRAIVVDAVVSGAAAGTVHEWTEGALPRSRTVDSQHDGSLAAALELGRAAGLELPRAIRIVGIEARDVGSFGESLTPEVERAVPVAVAAVLRSLDEAS